ncbi:MAG: glycoside hydrolase family 97 catalytic domain-containing protein [Bacteroidota bacterium]
MIRFKPQCRRFGITLLICFSLCHFAQSRQNEKIYKLSSPDKMIDLQVIIGQKIYFSAFWDAQRIIYYTPVSMTLKDNTWGDDPKIVSYDQETKNEVIKTVYGNRKVIVNQYNQLTLRFEGNYSLIFRAYNRGLAYRFTSNSEDSLTICNEELGLSLPESAHVWEPQESSYETDWKLKNVSSMERGRKLYLPLLFKVQTDNGSLVRLAVTEAGLIDYPSLFLSRSPTNENCFHSVFEKFPLSVKAGGYNHFIDVPDKTADFIAKTKGEREFTWRVFLITDDDRDLVDNDMVFSLSSPQKINNTKWIKPGQVLWDWWHDYNIEGASFKTGINNDTYRYFIDFASVNGIPYVNVDWKWSHFKDLMLPNPEVDIPELVKYAEQRNVKLIVWCISYTLEKQMEQAMNMFQEWGIAGIKVDFFDRDDQATIRMYERIAESAADHHLMVNFHGCSKPAGLQRTYPNIMNFEAVMGAEGNKWSESITPDHDLNIAFIRQICGSVDYTPGAMSNYGKGYYHITYPPGSQGTRCHQLAMYVVYLQPWAMLNDIPTAYAKEPEYFNILKSIPTTWDESKVLQAEAGEYVVMARRKEEAWYIGAMTNWNERNIEIDLSFLSDGHYSATLLSDGINANRLASDYQISHELLDKNEKITLELKQGGGAFIKLDHHE